MSRLALSLLTHEQASEWHEMKHLTHLKHEPLLHFLLLGAAIFAGLQPGVEGLQRRAGKDCHHAGPARVDAGGLHPHPATGRPPRRNGRGLIRARVREEVYYREALALGLDKDDTIIRRRLQQKIEFVSDDVAAQASPTDAELNAYLQAHPDKFRVEPRFTFRQVYLDPEKHGASLARDAAQLLAHAEPGRRRSGHQQAGRFVPAGSDVDGAPGRRNRAAVR